MKFNEPLGFPLTAAVGYFCSFQNFKRKHTFFFNKKKGKLGLTLFFKKLN
jgi:hypothetical protein